MKKILIIILIAFGFNATAQSPVKCYTEQELEQIALKINYANFCGDALDSCHLKVDLLLAESFRIAQILTNTRKQLSLKEDYLIVLEAQHEQVKDDLLKEQKLVKKQGKRIKFFNKLCVSLGVVVVAESFLLYIKR